MPDSAQVELIAKIIAMFHGGKMVVQTREGMQTVASLRGYGNSGDSLERYMHDHWREYDGAARAVIDVMEKADA